MPAGWPLLHFALRLGAASASSGVLAALLFAALLTAVVTAVALWKPALRQPHVVARLAGLFLFVFVVGLFRYGVLRLSNTTGMGLLVALFATCAALDWRNRRRRRS
jgi:hypothetical protein